MAARNPNATSASPAEPIRVETRGEHAVLHLEGVVGVAQGHRLHELALTLAGSGQAVKVRCEHVQHIDCAAAQVLLALQETLVSRGAGLTFQNLPDSAQRTLRGAGLAGAF